jgi:hypothetical protein
MNNETKSVSQEVSHTPTPWIAKHDVGESRISPKWGQFCMATFYSDNHDVDSDFIVRACNAHDDLLAALKKCEDVIGMARLQGKLSSSPLSPVNDALLAARAVLDQLS